MHPRPIGKYELAIEQKIASIYGASSTMYHVVKCESGFAQFDTDGKPYKSPTADIGVMQINQVNWGQAEALGLDIFNSTDDNIKMGQFILKEQGISAWTCFRGI